MSLVGPRMKTHEELERYGPCRDLISTVKPGLRGYSEVSPRPNLRPACKANPMGTAYAGNQLHRSECGRAQRRGIPRYEGKRCRANSNEWSGT